MSIPFTDRELTRAWRDLSSVVNSQPIGIPKNPHRLLLFYAVECGLKAIWLKRQGRTLFDGADIKQTGHDLREVLKALNVGSALSLPKTFRLPDALHSQTKAPLPRNGSIGDLHQVWRYGGQCDAPTDQDCEQQLQKVLTWIQGELK